MCVLEEEITKELEKVNMRENGERERERIVG